MGVRICVGDTIFVKKNKTTENYVGEFYFTQEEVDRFFKTPHVITKIYDASPAFDPEYHVSFLGTNCLFFFEKEFIVVSLKEDLGDWL